MNKREKLALFLGMFSGDGCLSLSHNSRRQKDYPIQFFNISLENVRLFDNLFYDLFGVRGRINQRKRANRKKIYHFRKHSKEIVEKMKCIGFREGKRNDYLRIPEVVKNGTRVEKILFIKGLAMTEGHFNQSGGLAFHLGTKDFIGELRIIISSLSKFNKLIKSYVQKDKYKSYQLYLNKEEKDLLLGDVMLVPALGSGRPVVLNDFKQ
jgi:hypothetical protein